jgi:tetratricopeptide (TPR) repeat protein
MKPPMKKSKASEDKLFQECSVHYRKQEWKQILDKVIRAGGLIRGRLDETRTLILAGAAARSIGQLKEAEQLWLNAFELDPKNADALNNLGVINRESGR